MYKWYEWPENMICKFADNTLKQGCQSQPLRIGITESGFCLPLRGWGGHGLVVVADWVDMAGVGRGQGGRGWSLAVSGTAPWVYHRPELAQGHVFYMSALKDTNKVQGKFVKLEIQGPKIAE